MTVYFIGAGPGAADLITVRGLKLIERCKTCLYAGSLVPLETVSAAPGDARVRNTASMHLDEIVEEMSLAHRRGEDVARVHSGDPSVYGAIAEQIRRLDALDIPIEVVPGVPAFAGAAAKLQTELTLPGVAQTIIITRTSGKASDMPEHETLEILGQSRATLAIHLSIRNLRKIEETLTPFYGASCPVVIAWRATWPDEKYFQTTLSAMRETVRREKITRTALILVGQVFGQKNFQDSALYSANFTHVLRNKGKKKKNPGVSDQG